MKKNKTNLYKKKPIKAIKLVFHQNKNDLLTNYNMDFNNKINSTFQSFHPEKTNNFEVKEINNNNTINYINNSLNKSFDNTSDIKDYIFYLKNQLNSSYYACNELKNEYSTIVNKSKDINETINNNNKIIADLNKSYQDKIELNKKYKSVYKNLLDQYKLNHLNVQNKLKELYQIQNYQDKILINLEKKNRKLNKEINDKNIYTEKLRKKIEDFKNKKKIIEVKNEYVQLINKKIITSILNGKLKLLIESKEKNDKLNNSINSFKINLADKIKIFEKLQNKKNQLFHKLIQIEQNINKNSDIIGNKSINYYKDLIDKESKKSEKYLNDKNFYIQELLKLKKEVLTLKLKEINNIKNQKKKKDMNNKEPFTLLKQINNQNEYLNENKNFNYKHSLKNKIEIINKDNNEINKEINKINEKKENKEPIGFKIQAIKIRRNEKKNLKKIENVRNLSETDLLIKPVQKNNCLYISKNSEEFIPQKEIYKYKKYEYRIYNNELKIINSFSFDNIFEYNSNKNKIEQEVNIDILSTPRTGQYLYTINNGNKLLGYQINLKNYVYINTSSIKGWNIFFKNYKNNSNGSLILNTLSGFFILTGDNYDSLYYYSQSKNIIFLISKLKYNHKYGGLILTKDNNKIIILGGEYFSEVELFDIQNNILIKLPPLKSKRINSSYNIINDQYIMAFFGKNNKSIEYLDLTNINFWKILNYRSNSSINDLNGHISYHVNKNIVIIVGGKNNKKIMVFYFAEKYIDVTDFVLEFEDNCDIKELIFDKEKCFNIVENKDNKTFECVGMDNYGNVHCFDNNYSYTIFLF